MLLFCLQDREVLSSTVELEMTGKIKGRRGLPGEAESCVELRTSIVLKDRLNSVLKVNDILLCSCFFDEIYSLESDDVCYNKSGI